MRHGRGDSPPVNPVRDNRRSRIPYGLLSDGGRGRRVRTTAATPNPNATAATAIATVKPSEYPTTDT
jgi:hypothetical protein